ncbi:MAG: 50S ribosomal protein L29 [Bacteroidetes bacterium]|nr:50S ribosomal protein L29 [Bacteroidota bacterium]
MKKADLSQLSTNDLEEKLKEEVASLDKMKFTHTISPVESPARITHSRKTVARMMTELRKRELAETKK